MEILVVDDSEIVLELERIMLESYGFPVVTAENGEKAVELAWEKKFDIIFMDIHMTGMDGYTAARKIREYNPTVPIIALSAETILPTDEPFASSGMSGILQKPMKLTALTALLEEHAALLPAEEKHPLKRNRDTLFDYEGLLSALGSERTLLHIVQQFLSFHRDDCKRIRQYVTDGDYSAAREILHNITGVSGNLCCYSLYEASVTLGTELRLHTAVSLEKFANVWNQTTGELSECCSNLTAKYGIGNLGADWCSVWNDFCWLCQEFDVESVRLFLSNKQLFEEHMLPQEFAELKQYITMYDFLPLTERLEAYHV